MSRGRAAGRASRPGSLVRRPASEPLAEVGVRLVEDRHVRSRLPPGLDRPQEVREGTHRVVVGNGRGLEVDELGRAECPGSVPRAVATLEHPLVGLTRGAPRAHNDRRLLEPDQVLLQSLLHREPEGDTRAGEGGPRTRSGSLGASSCASAAALRNALLWIPAVAVSSWYQHQQQLPGSPNPIVATVQDDARLDLVALAPQLARRGVGVPVREVEPVEDVAHGAGSALDAVQVAVEGPRAVGVHVVGHRGDDDPQIRASPWPGAIGAGLAWTPARSPARPAGALSGAGGAARRPAGPRSPSRANPSRSSCRRASAGPFELRDRQGRHASRFEPRLFVDCELGVVGQTVRHGLYARRILDATGPDLLRRPAGVQRAPPDVERYAQVLGQDLEGGAHA